MNSTSLEAILTRYPRLKNVLGKVPTDALIADLQHSVEKYERIRVQAAALIPTVNLEDVVTKDTEQGSICLTDFLGTWGNVSVEELCKICLAAKWLQPSAVFEFGTYNGLTTRQLAINAPHATLYTLDIPPDSEGAAELQIGAIDQHLAQKTGNFAFEVGCKFAGTQESSRIVQLWGNSTTFDYRPFVGRINLIFIDAGHTYEYVKSDSLNALALLDTTRDGLIFWHDYDQPLHPDVLQCVTELAQAGNEIKHLRNTNLAVLCRGGSQQTRLGKA